MGMGRKRDDDMKDQRWNKVTTSMLAAFAMGMGAFLLLVFLSEPGFVFIVDHANLLFHEAGHPIIGIFSTRLETYGGTIGQLVFPIALAVSFWRKGQTLSFAGAIIWFFENWLNIARYMADAREQVLPLVGGGDHDWANIFGRWRILAHDTQIAQAVRILGWTGMIIPCTWVVWLWWRQRGEPEVTPDFDLITK
ncbi:hypothetical protein Cflav_PD1803 [Pedosphaera parvula Ellin514]|uniref:Uncharacterized protein n=2 Tax=Pedosphaera TaxID=1032526 RepID=B9XN45_PEDPL|nr:hypothetical protein Cflav_PD1803 [Pedosphaera parvula Ellin514]